MRNLKVSPAILEKLAKKHQVTVKEVEQCFQNKCGSYLEDTRELHKSDPPTLWFVAPTNTGRNLKVVFIYRDGSIYLKSAFQADEISMRIYDSAAH